MEEINFNTLILKHLFKVKIFVSYSRRDAGDFANQIQKHLSIFKYDIFTDVDSIRAGEIWSNAIEENISDCDIFVVVVTHGALKSPHVENEVLQAQREKKKIIPCFFENINPNKIKWGLDKIQGVEFTNEYQLARDLYSKINIETIDRPLDNSNNIITEGELSKDIQVGDINVNVLNIIEEIKSYGLKFLQPTYFQEHQSTQKEFDEWKNGFRFELPSIMEGKNFKRSGIINKIIDKLDNNNEDHALILLGQSGTSKSNLLMDIMCHYYKNSFIVFYNFGEEEVKDVYGLEKSLIERLKEGNKILVAVDDVHYKRTAAIFSVIDSLRSYTEKKDNIRFLLTGRQPEFDRFVNDRLGEIPSEQIRKSIRKLSARLKFEIPNFDPKEIKEFIKQYKNEEEIKNSFNVQFNVRYDKYNELFNDEKKIDNISSLIFNKTEKGYPILVKFLLFGKGLYEDMKSRYDVYLANDNNIMKLYTMLICSILDRASIAITENLLSELNIISYARELKNQTLIFSEIEKKWKTLHVKWDLELLTYLYSEKDEYLLEKRIKILNNSLQSIMTIIRKEEDQYLIIGSLYDSTTIDTEQKNILPINIISRVITNGEISYVDNLSKFWRFNIYNNYIAKNYYYLKKCKESLDAIEEVFNIYPNNTNIILNKGVVLSCLGEEENAITYFNKVIKSDPTNINAWYNKGKSLDNLGRHEEAIECYNKIILKLNPRDVDAWYNKGVSLGKLKRYEDEIKCYDHIINKLDPTHISAWYYKGVSLGKLKRYKEAIQCYNQIITILDPKYVDAWLNKGVTLGILGRYEEAIQYFDEIITNLNPRHSGAWYNKGNALSRLNRYPEAKICYDKASELDYGNK
jgi:tetratricopeptide (TPR) repeat protein